MAFDQPQSISISNGLPAQLKLDSEISDPSHTYIRIREIVFISN